MTESSELHRAAYHEAGHAVMAAHFHHKIELVSIMPMVNTVGRTICYPPKAILDVMEHDKPLTSWQTKALRQQILFFASGPTAEDMFCGTQGKERWCDDFDRILELELRRRPSATPPEELVTKYTTSSKRILKKNGNLRAVKALAARLLRDGRIGKPNIRLLIREARARG